MSDIIKSEQGIIKTKKELEFQNIIDVSLKPKLSTYSHADADTMIKYSIANAVVISREAIMHADDISTNAREIYSYAMENFPEITPEEIHQALRRGALGEYGKYYGHNAKSYIEFCWSYLESEERRLAFQSQKKEQRQLVAPIPKLTVGDYKKLILNDYRLFKEKSIIIFDIKRYWFLEKMGYIEIVTGDKWQSWLLKGREKLKDEETIRAFKNGDIKSLKEITQTMNIIEETGEVEKKMLYRIKKTARKLRYFAYFDYLQRNNIQSPFN